MFFVVSYDVVNDRRRARLHKLLKGYGQRVQRSVFECILDAAAVSSMKEKIHEVIDSKTDSVRYYALCTPCSHKVEVKGIGSISKKKSVVVVGS